MAKQSSSVKQAPKKGLPTIAVVGIGCLGLLVLIGIGMGVAGKVLFSGIGQKFVAEGVKKGIESKTGVKMETGKDGEIVSWKDTKTGTEVNMGDNLPSDFPKDFPLYSGAKPTGNISGNATGEGRGWWVTFETADSYSKVKAFYDANLKKSGWTIDETMTAGNASTWTVTKGTLEGSVVVTGEEQKDKTTIIVSLNPKMPETPEE